MGEEGGQGLVVVVSHVSNKLLLVAYTEKESLGGTENKEEAENGNEDFHEGVARLPFVEDEVFVE